MLACGCAESDDEDNVALGWEVTEHNLTLSGAEYKILLTAVNAAGPGPAQQLHVPPDQHAGTCPSRNAELPWQPSGRYFFPATLFHRRSQLQGDQCGRQHRDCAVGGASLWRCLLLRAADTARASQTGSLHPAGIPCQQHPPGDRQGSAPSPPLSPHPGSGGLTSTPVPPQESWERRAVAAWPCTAGTRSGAGPPSPCGTATPETVCVRARDTAPAFAPGGALLKQPPGFSARRFPGRARQHQHQHRGCRRCPPVGAVPTCRLSRRAAQVPGLPRDRGGQCDP